MYTMFSKESLYSILNKVNFLFFFNFVIVLIYISSQNYLEEDLIIGFCSNVILFIILFSLKELKGGVLRLFRRKVKKNFRIQKVVLKRYYFCFFKLLKSNFVYFRTILFYYFVIKLTKLSIKVNLKLTYFYSKLIFIKIFYLNFIRFLSLKFLKFSLSIL